MTQIMITNNQEHNPADFVIRTLPKSFYKYVILKIGIFSV